MKKISYGIMFIAGIISIVLIIMYDSKKEIILNEKKKSKLEKEQVAMMYETSKGSGEYTTSNNSKWPQEGYVFNENLSKCEKGSKIRWDGTNNSVILEGNISDKCYIYFDVGNYASSYIKSLYTTDGANGLYLHDSDLANGAGDNSLRYAGGEYRIIKEEYLNSSKTSPIKGGLIKLYCVYSDEDLVLTPSDGWDEESITINECLSTYYTLSYDTNNTHYATFEEALAKAISDGYVEKTPTINNYVCFGSDENNCPEDNLYRIIGVFDNQIKLVKATKASSDLLGVDGEYTRGSDKYDYYWKFQNYSASNIKNSWLDSQLNTINLNKNYINNIGKKWSDMIDEHNWNLGGFAINSDFLTAKEIFDAELGNCDTCTGKEVITNAKIGLIYVSDYLYAQDSLFWQQYNRAKSNRTIDSNWLYLSDRKKGYWTVSKANGHDQDVWQISDSGIGYASTTFTTGGGYVFPTFYLNSNVKITSGEGTKTNPYRIA